MSNFFRALPAYFGGKRRLCRLLFSLLATTVPPDRWRGSGFIDPFLGGGSVSLYAKSQGFHVRCNDIALRSAAIGRALIANSAMKLSEADVAALFRAPAGAYAKVAEERYCPNILPLAHARILDRALFNVASLPEPRRSLAILLLVKWVLRIQPMSMLRGTDARSAFAGDLDQVSPHRLGHYLRAERLLQPAAWLSLATEVNCGVFPGGGEAFQADVFAFLGSVAGDVVYFDPPYPGTTSYEKEYAVLDELLEGQTRTPSSFSRSPDILPDLFGASRHIPVWLVSLNNSVLALEELCDLVRRHKRTVRSLEIPYRHLASIASEVKNATNREFIVIASD